MDTKLGKIERQAFLAIRRPLSPRNSFSAPLMVRSGPDRRERVPDRCHPPNVPDRCHPPNASSASEFLGRHSREELICLWISDRVVAFVPREVARSLQPEQPAPKPDPRAGATC